MGFLSSGFHTRKVLFHHLHSVFPLLVSGNRATRSNEILVESDAGTIMAGVSLFHNYEMERGFLSFDLILCDVCIRQIVKIGVYFGFGQITV